MTTRLSIALKVTKGDVISRHIWPLKNIKDEKLERAFRVSGLRMLAAEIIKIKVIRTLKKKGEGSLAG